MRALSWLRIGVFLGCIVGPLTAMRGAGGEGLEHEQRSRAAMPSLRRTGAQFPELFDAYFRDHFGWRDRIIRWHHLLKYRALRESPVDAVIVGGNGWLFYSAAADGMDIRNFSGHWPHDAADVNEWLTRQESRRQQYLHLGARYLIAVAPDKQSVYADFVPFRYGPHAAGVMGELLARAQLHPNLQLLDLAPVLRGHAGAGMYYKSDTHWNAQGAFVAAAAIADGVRQQLRSVGVIRASDYVVESSPRGVGDLANMMGLGLPVDDLRYTYRRRSGGAREIRSEPLRHVFEQPGTTQPKAVLLGDSFGDTLAPILADAFSRLHYYRSSTAPPDPTLVAREAPDVVILIIAERYLPQLGRR